jgi:hypothetical protein
MEGDGARVALDGVVLLLFALALHLLAFHLLPLPLLTLAVGMLFLLALTLHHLPLSGVALTLAIELRRRMLHSLADSRQGVAGIVGGRMRTVRLRLVRGSVALAQFCQARERVATRLTARVVGT